MLPKSPLPMVLPGIVITPSLEPPFSVVCPEALWMFRSLNLGDAIWWGLYDPPGWILSSLSHTQTTRKARIHGIEGVEVLFDDWELQQDAWIQSQSKVYLAEVGGEVRTLAAAWEENGAPCLETYLDPEFDANWNGGVSMNLRDEGRFQSAAPNEYVTANPQASPGAGRYTVSVGNRSCDCLRVLDVQDGILSEGYLLRDGHVLLDRRYNASHWKVGPEMPYGPQPWDERFPKHARIRIDDVTYVHWYDTVSDAAFSN